MEVVKQIFLFKNNKINLVITSKGFATKEGNTFNEIIKDQFPTLKKSADIKVSDAEIFVS